MSLTVVSFGAAVRVGGEHDHDGKRGFVLLAVEPNPALLTRRAARWLLANEHDMPAELSEVAEQVSE